MNSENLFSESYALQTAKAYTKRHPIGYDFAPADKYRTQNATTFKAKSFRRFSKFLFIFNHVNFSRR